MRARGLKQLSELSDAELIAAHPKLNSGARLVLGVENAVKAFQSSGSTGPEEVKKQVEVWVRRLAARR